MPCVGQAKRRLKNKSVSTVLDVKLPPVPMLNSPAFSRKKSRFSGKIQARPREVHLLLVHLHLREIGVVGDVEVEPRPSGVTNM